MCNQVGRENGLELNTLLFSELICRLQERRAATSLCSERRRNHFLPVDQPPIGRRAI